MQPLFLCRKATPGCTSLKHGSPIGGTLKPSSAKSKGRVLQQWVRDQLIARFPIEADDCRSVSMGVSGEDLLLSPHARRYIPLSFECKSRAAISVYGFYEQAQSNSGGAEPVVIIKQNRSKPLAVIDAGYLFDVIAKSKGL